MCTRGDELSWEHPWPGSKMELEEQHQGEHEKKGMR
jgi:hypothetical protein